MRILQLHNRYQVTGGEEGVVQAEQQLLRDRGHAVQLLEVSNDDISSPLDQALVAVKAIYSIAAKRQVEQAIAHFQPDVVHVHNFFPLLSPAVYDACHDRQVPVVQTLHNYRLACPKAMFFRDGEICETCLETGSPWPGVKYGCYRGSSAQTAVIASMLAIHGWRKTWQERVNALIALTEFQRQKLIQAGLPSDRLHVKPNFLNANPKPRQIPEVPFVLSVGRLSEEKGIDVAIAAYTHNPHLPLLKIVGDGPMRTALEQQVQAANLNHKIIFLGRQDKSQILDLMRQAIALIFPSIWYAVAFPSSPPSWAAWRKSWSMKSQACIFRHKTRRHWPPRFAISPNTQPFKPRSAKTPSKSIEHATHQTSITNNSWTSTKKSNLPHKKPLGNPNGQVESELLSRFSLACAAALKGGCISL
jgi:glycosyltransferase involved in cell wall biosynthesis